MAIAIAVIGVLVALGWMPVFRHFWRSWRKRNNPISLAICGLVGFMVYINLAVYIFMKNDPAWTAIVVGGVNVAVLLNFYLCLRWAKKLFPEAIKRGKRLTDAECRKQVAESDS